jgi:SAM-dependent methyltransferase
MTRKQPARDTFELYQEAVQDPASETRLIQRVYRRLRGKNARVLREDFCGTAILACEWVRWVRGGSAEGIDLDLPTLTYAREHALAALGKKASRVKLVHGDVLTAGDSTPDVVAAFNFSYFVFKSRAVLRRYFTRVHRVLARDGVFFLDLYGGPQAQEIMEEKTVHRGFTYVWDQVRYNPITGETLCHIHFEFPDGSRLAKAFTYDWRIWTLPEIRDLLEEVGFGPVEVYWEGTDRTTGEGNGIFRRSMKGDDASSWIAYVAAAK